MNNKLTEPCRPSIRHRYQSSLEDMAEADRLGEWLVSITLPETFQLAIGVQVVDGRLFRIRLLQDLKETRHTAMFIGTLARAHQVHSIFPQLKEIRENP